MTILRGTRIAVVSPHLDDAVFSLGSAMSATARAGKDVRIVTVFAGDPESAQPAAWWDRATGFETHRQAALRRREEDVRACELVGVTPCWLPFGDATYVQDRDADTVWAAIAEAVEDADT